MNVKHNRFQNPPSVKGRFMRTMNFSGGKVFFVLAKALHLACFQKWALLFKNLLETT